MYFPKLFREEDRERVLAFLKENNVPVFVTHGEAGIVATHLAVEVVEDAGGVKVYGHMARGNGQWKALAEEVLLIFQGAHAYISPTWYNHLNVPTWNYTMVHVYGKARVLGEEELKSALGRLTGTGEARGCGLGSGGGGNAQEPCTGMMAFPTEWRG
jgi:transcriptional regulator